jgi:cytochrome P450 family 104
VKDNAALFGSDDLNTPMERAFLAHTLMRKDHDEHRIERMAMMPALMPKTIESVWAALYAKLAAAHLDRLPRGEVVDLLAGPLAARILAYTMGVPDASDEDSHVVDADRGRRQFWLDARAFQRDRHRQCGNGQMSANAERMRAESDSSALSFMVNAKDPIPETRCKDRDRRGGINEPRPSATARITARAHTRRGEPLAPSCYQCCSSASPT